MAGYAPIGNATFYSTAFTYNALLSDGDDVVSRSGTVASGIGVLKRGAILKIVPATGVITVPAAATDCNCILSNDIDATSATVAAVVYLSGKFKADAVIWPGALAHGDVADALRNYTILIESVVFTDGTLVKSVPTEAEAAEAQKHLEEARKKQEESLKAAEAAATGKEDPEDPNKPKPSDSVWAYLTPEEREKSPQLAEPPVVVPPPVVTTGPPVEHHTPVIAPQHTQPHVPPSAQAHNPPLKNKEK